MVSTANAINTRYVTMFCVVRQESLAKNGLEKIAGANAGDFSFPNVPSSFIMSNVCGKWGKIALVQSKNGSFAWRSCLDSQLLQGRRGAV